MSELASPEHEEVYLFGLAGPSLRKRRLDFRALAIHMTNERIFVLYASLWMQITIFAVSYACPNGCPIGIGIRNFNRFWGF